jgi:hypothetical protein
MAALLAIVCFAIAFIMQIAGWTHGNFNSLAVTILGLVFLAVALVWPYRPWVHTTPAP